MKNEQLDRETAVRGVISHVTNSRDAVSEGLLQYSLSAACMAVWLQWSRVTGVMMMMVALLREAAG